MTPAQRQLQRAQAARTGLGTAPMTESETRNLAAKLAAAVAARDEDNAEEAAMLLLSGVAVNIARIADALAKD